MLSNQLPATAVGLPRKLLNPLVLFTLLECGIFREDSSSKTTIGWGHGSEINTHLSVCNIIIVT